MVGSPAAIEVNERPACLTAAADSSDSEHPASPAREISAAIVAIWKVRQGDVGLWLGIPDPIYYSIHASSIRWVVHSNPRISDLSENGSRILAHLGLFLGKDSAQGSD